ncbi:hypothetical protein JCM8547_008910 [Rhodosporidiobolus lusitaniae]
MSAAGAGASEGYDVSTVAAALLERLHESRAQADLISLLFSAVLFGVATPLFFRYLSLFWNGNGVKNTPQDGVWLRGFVLALFMFATGYIAVIAAAAWDHLTTSIAAAGVFSPASTSLQTSQNWVLLVYGGVVEGYWTWRICRVGRHWMIEVIAVAVWCSSVAAYLAVCVLSTRALLGFNSTFSTIALILMIGIWLSLITTIITSSVLGYEIWRKQQGSIVPSSRMERLMELALRTTAAIVVCTIASAVSATVAYATGSNTALLSSMVTTDLYFFGSLNCVLYSLLTRHSTRRPSIASTANRTLPALSDGWGKIKRSSSANAAALAAQERRNLFAGVSVEIEVEQATDIEEAEQTRAERRRRDARLEEG